MNYQQRFEQEGDLAKAREYAQIYRLVMDLLDQIYELLGEEEISLQEFADILEAGFEEHQIILSRYIIRFIFTTVYKDNFLLVLNENEIFIKDNICKILDNFKEKDIKFNLLLDEDDDVQDVYHNWNE